MQIADLFDANTREAAARELTDDDLIIAAVVMTQERTPDARKRDRIGENLAWLALQARSSTTATSITRQALTLVMAENLFQAFRRVTEYRRPTALLSRRRADIRADEAAHVAATANGPAVLAELGRYEAQRMLHHENGSHIGFVQEMLPYIQDLAVLKGITESARLISQKLVVARIWELGDRDLVASIVHQDEYSMWSTKAARNAAIAILEPVPTS